jgi:hypothetical protein
VFFVSALPRLLLKTTKTLALQCSKEALWRKWARLPYPTTWFRTHECVIFAYVIVCADPSSALLLLCKCALFQFPLTFAGLDRDVALSINAMRGRVGTMLSTSANFLMLLLRIYDPVRLRFRVKCERGFRFGSIYALSTIRTPLIMPQTRPQAT